MIAPDWPCAIKEFQLYVMLAGAERIAALPQ